MILLEKWFQTMKVTWSNLLIYRVNFLLQVIGPLLVFLLIKVSLWSSVFASPGSKELIGGYDLASMLKYHLWIMIANILIFSSSSQNLAEDIRLGRISTYLIYPFSFWQFHTAQYLARQGVQLVIASLTIFIVFIVDSIYQLNFQITLERVSMGFFLAIFGSVFWFSINYLIGMISFWLEETWTLTVLVQVITYFFSGAIIPLELFPETLQNILQYTPFPYIAFVPVKAFMGETPDLLFSLSVLTFWIMTVLGCSMYLWRRGLRLYTAAGM